MSTGSILVIDGRPESRTALVAAVVGADYSSLEAGTAAEGMNLLSSLHPQIVVLDIDHLDNGLELARQIKLENADVPVLILSNSGDPDLVVKGMRSGADDFLVKPARHRDPAECLQGGAGPERRNRRPGCLRGRRRGHRPAGPEPRPPVPQQRAHAGRGGYRPPGRRHQCHHPPPGRERHRQGDGGPGHPPYLGPPGQAVPEGQLRVPPGRPPRVRAVRPREGLLHRGPPPQARQVRARPPGDLLARRDRRDAPRAPGQAAARAPGRPVLPGGRQRRSSRPTPG